MEQVTLGTQLTEVFEIFGIALFFIAAVFILFKVAKVVHNKVTPETDDVQLYQKNNAAYGISFVFKQLTIHIYGCSL